MLFSGLNAEAYGTLKNTVKNAWTTSGINSLPKTTADVIKMADEFVDPRTSKRVRANAQPGVAFITPGEEVSPSPKPTSGKANKSKTKISDAKPKSGEPVKHPDSGKLVECFHCLGNHYISDCLDISAAQKAELLAARMAANNKRHVEKAQRETAQEVKLI